MKKSFIHYPTEKNHCNIDTLPIRLMPHTDFAYPMEEESVIKDNDIRESLDYILHTLLIDLIKTKSPLTYIVALCYIFGINMEEVIDKPYTKHNCAVYCGITRQSFGEQVARLRKRYDIKRNSSGGIAGGINNNNLQRKQIQIDR